jgi:hypothetical protein
VHRLLEDPRSDPRRIVAPAGRSRAEREAEEGERGVGRRADLARVDQRFHPAVLGGVPELVADGQNPVAGPRGRQQPVAVRERGRHRFLEQHVLAGL